MSRIILAVLALGAGDAMASGLEESQTAFNWFTLGDPHSLPMGWVFLNFLIFVTKVDRNTASQTSTGTSKQVVVQLEDEEEE